MKLVDILASELNAWPVEYGVEFVTQDNTGHVYGWKRMPICIHGEWLCSDDGSHEDLTTWRPGNIAMSEDRKEAIVTRDQWEVAVEALKFESATAWSGDDRPPVGTYCDIARHVEGVWMRGTINYLSEHTCVIRLDDMPGEFLGHPDTLKFRPARTAEQIAAEERLHQVRNALSAIHAGQKFPNDFVRGNIVAATVEAMIDAGYRKQAGQ